MSGNRQKSRNYYTEVAENLPKDTVILTAGCAKYRYNKLALGDIGGIPRVLDAGQCNDSYSLAVIALKLKEAFGLEDINDLPAFLSPNVAKVLVEKFDIKPIGTVQDDIAAMMAGK
jgi:hydroxylamine reductase